MSPEDEKISVDVEYSSLEVRLNRKLLKRWELAEGWMRSSTWRGKRRG